MRFRGLVYRALNPVYARDPLSGAGAARYGGRFNARGRPALYASLAPDTAIREANQIGFLQPTTLVAYRADIAPVFDATDPAAVRGQGLAPGVLGDPAWRHGMNRGAPVPTQDLAEALIAAGYAGLRVASFAPGATAGDVNLVLWRWNAGPDTRLDLIDDEGRLGR
ncbi:RES domain-containing protein [Thalassobaculum sp.]|uniref:RES family NAD+ phosphorylase n=1 Tax=Thalassobaculum sp. TaxID=2022740 RepID=UPI0032EEB905